MEGSESWPYVQVPLWESKTLCNQRTVRKLKKKKKIITKGFNII